MRRPNTKLMSVLTVAAALTACGGSSDDGGGGGGTVTTTAVSGTASKGIVIAGVVTIYPLVNGVADTANPLGSATTDSSGKYSIDLPSDYDGGPIVVQVTPASDGTTQMRCDVPSGCGGTVAFGDDYTLAATAGFEMNAIVAEATAGQTVTVNPTPLTEIATQVALQTLAATSSPSDFAIVDAISDANSSTADRFGITGAINDQPVIDITDPAEVAAALADSDIGADGVRYNSLAGAIVEATQDDNSALTIEQALAAFTDSYVDNGGIAGNTGTTGTTSLEEVLTAAQEVLTETTEQTGGSDLNLTEVTTDLTTDSGEAGNETPDAPTSGTPSPTAADGELAQVKAMIADLRDIGGSVSTQLTASADAFAEQIDMASLATSDSSSAAMQALGTAAEAIAEGLEAISDDDTLPSFVASNGLTVTFGTGGISAAAVTATDVTANVNATVTESGVDNVVAITAVVDLTLDETETGVETPNFPAPGTSDSGIWTFSGDLDVAFSLSGTVTNPGVVLAVTNGDVTVDVAIDETETWTHSNTGEGVVDVDETDGLDVTLSFSFDLDVSLTQQGVVDPVTFAGGLDFSLLGVAIHEESTFTNDNTGSPDFNSTVRDTWTSTAMFTSLGMTLSGEFSTATQSFGATFAVSAEGNGVTFTDNGSWTGTYSSTSGSTSEETSTSSDNESTTAFVDASVSLGFAATLAGISDDVAVTFAVSRSGLEAATASIDLAWDGHRLDMDFTGSDTGGSATIANQDGVTLSVAEGSDGVVAGTLTNNGSQYATVDDNGVIRYVDETIESF